MFVLAAAARLLDIIWFHPWAREVERADLWTIEQIDNIELMFDFARLIPSAIGTAFMVIVIARAKQKMTAKATL